MIKKLCIVFLAFLALNVYAQEGTVSPYSFYGIGSIKFKGTVENRSMGNISIFSDSIHVNLRNPAANGGNKLKMFNEEGRLVKFTVGASHTETTLKTANQSDNTNVSTFDYMALSLPMGKFGATIGVTPFTSVGYRLEAEDMVADTILPVNRYTGEGGLNRVFLSFGYQLTKDLSVGVEANYFFGNIQNNALEFVYDDEGDPLQYQSRQRNRSDLSGFNFNIGAIYNPMISDRFQLTTAFVYTPSADLKSQNERIFETVAINPFSGIEFPVGEIIADLSQDGLETTDLTLPSKTSFGAGIGQPHRWFVGAEYSFLKTSEFANPIAPNVTNSEFEDSSSFNLGGFVIPNYRSFNSYWSRVVYRAGVRFENTGLKINGESINEFGISFGVGLPMGRLLSNTNIGFEYGQLGTTSANLVQENFFSFQISLSLNDRWFQKRKLN